MTPEWETIVGVGIPAIAVSVWLVTKLNKIDRGNAHLIHMHENPENTGFGTIGFKTVIQENTRAIRELSHYMKWQVKSHSGADPPPYTGELGDGG